MSELDEIFSQDIKLAIETARENNRFSIADYLSLKQTNDEIRRRSVRWLNQTVFDIVKAFNDHGANINLEQKEDHQFRFGNSNLRGSLVQLKLGVRCFKVEAGWTRTPTDGFMRGNALACAKLTHFGFAKMNEDLVLLKYENSPQWFSILDERNRRSFDMKSLKPHFEIFLG